MLNYPRSTVMSHSRDSSSSVHQSSAADTSSSTTTGGDKPRCDSLFVPADLRQGNFTTTCGHPMHATCWRR